MINIKQFIQEKFLIDNNVKLDSTIDQPAFPIKKFAELLEYYFEFANTDINKFIKNVINNNRSYREEDIEIVNYKKRLPILYIETLLNKFNHTNELDNKIFLSTNKLDLYYFSIFVAGSRRTNSNMQLIIIADKNKNVKYTFFVSYII